MQTYGISQNRLAEAMGIERPNVSRWANEVRDPGAETLLEIRRGLQKINPSAAEKFIELYLDQSDDENHNNEM